MFDGLFEEETDKQQVLKNPRYIYIAGIFIVIGYLIWTSKVAERTLSSGMLYALPF